MKATRQQLAYAVMNRISGTEFTGCAITVKHTDERTTITVSGFTVAYWLANYGWYICIPLNANDFILKRVTEILAWLQDIVPNIAFNICNHYYVGNCLQAKGYGQSNWISASFGEFIRLTDLGFSNDYDAYLE